ncbi:hypothetical protein PQR62_14890 [Herbaspirillum lusitanum]|uniref:Uncharacterized protein n=1 Tax=Herbaspirillum lusitanum TaxID=213312 RepID=A0ABW9ABG9_9BURK
MDHAAGDLNGKMPGSWMSGLSARIQRAAHAARLPVTTRARLSLRRASTFGSLLAFMLIDFSRYFFDQGNRHTVL